MAGVERMLAADIEPNAFLFGEGRKAQPIFLAVFDESLKRRSEAG